MSYRFPMYLKQCNNIGEAFTVANEAVNRLMNHSKEILRNNRSAIPVRDYDNPYPEWLYELHNYKFVYFKEANVLGLVGNFDIEEVTELFDTYLYFQNSCDQDYNYYLWNDKILAFKELKARILSLSDEELVNAIATEESDICTYSENHKIEMLEDIDYHRRTYLYKKIVEQLGIEDFIYEEKPEKYEVFVLNGIKSSHQYFQLCEEFKKFVKPLAEEQKTLKNIEPKNDVDFSLEVQQYR